MVVYYVRMANNVAWSFCRHFVDGALQSVRIRQVISIEMIKSFIIIHSRSLPETSKLLCKSAPFRD